MEDFEPLVRVIRMRLAFGQTLEEIHDAVPITVSEEMFFLAWHAAQILDKEHDAPVP